MRISKKHIEFFGGIVSTEKKKASKNLRKAKKLKNDNAKDKNGQLE